MMQRARVIAAKVKMFLILPMVIMNIQKMLVCESIPRAIRASVSSLTEVVLIGSVRCGVCFIINKIHEKLLSSDWLR